MEGSNIQDIEEFLFHEAALLDDRRFEEWLNLLTEDIKYWVPNYAEFAAPAEYGVIVYEDLEALRARVARITHPLNPTQMPAPRTCRFISNIIVSSVDDREVNVMSNILLYICRDARLYAYPGKVAHRLRKEGERWKICAKTVNLLANNTPLSQLPIL
jgi:3-phenylpropionate/cinnamic acid dioxygenase small subunit